MACQRQELALDFFLGGGRGGGGCYNPFLSERRERRLVQGTQQPEARFRV